MQQNVDVVNILQIPELAPAANVNLSWVLPISDPNVPASKKYTLQDIATIISSQIGSVTIPDPKFYAIATSGGAAAPGDNTITDTDLADGRFYLFKWGVGLLELGIDYQLVSGGGFMLLNGKVFYDQEEYQALFMPKISNILVAPDAIGKIVAGVKVLPASTTLGSTDYRKLIVLQGAEFFTLPSAADYPPNILLPIISLEGPRKQSTILTQSGQVIVTNSGTLNTLYIGQNEHLNLISNGTSWYVQSASPSILSYNPYVQFGWWNQGANTLPAAGNLILRADYPRVWNFIVRLAASPGGAAMVKSDSGGWLSDRTRWGSGDGVTNFRMPDVTGYFPRWLPLNGQTDVDRVSSGLQGSSGSAQAPAVGPHQHNIVAGHQGNISQQGQTHVVLGTQGPTAGNILDVTTPLSTATSENRPINAGFYPIINV